MRINNLLLLLLTGIICIPALVSCDPVPRIDGRGNSYYKLANSAITYEGDRSNDAGLKAVTIPCQDNNTFRLYYSDSAALYGLPDSLTIVSYNRRTQLRYKECYIEATSSATDTWLSTGSGKMKVKAGTGEIHINDAVLQHFTSTPQADSTTIVAVLAAQ